MQWGDTFSEGVFMFSYSYLRPYGFKTALEMWYKIGENKECLFRKDFTTLPRLPLLDGN